MKPINIIPISGGKDSQAVALLYLKELKKPKEEALFLFCDVENEHDDVYTHLDYLESELGIKILRLKADLTEKMDSYEDKYGETFDRKESVFLNSSILHGTFPRVVGRWCTKELKIEVMYKYIEDENLLDTSTVVIWQGIRREESIARKDVLDIEEYCKGISLYRPIASWKLKQVLDLSKKYNVKLCNLYYKGAKRVGCYPCIYSNSGEIGALPKETIHRIYEWECRLANQKVKLNKEGRKFWPFFLKPEIDRKYSANIIDYSEYCKNRFGIDKLEIDNRCSNEYGMCE